MLANFQDGKIFKMPWIDDASKLVNKMVARKDSEFFREPVLWEELGLLDYPKIITQPMDFQTVRQNIDNNRYTKQFEFANDIRLICMNAMTYNAPGSRVYANAKSLNEYFESSWASISTENDPDKPPTYGEMCLWVEKCHRLGPDELGIVLKALDKTCPNSLVKKATLSEVEINVDLINGKTFRIVNNLVDEIDPDLLTSSRRPAKNANK